MEALLKLNSVSAMADIKKIRQIYDQVEIQVRGLQAQVWIRSSMAHF